MTAATTCTTTNVTAHDIGKISPKMAHQWLSDGDCVLIDVREPAEHARERIVGSTLLSLSKFNLQTMAALVRPGQKVVVHCRGGSRSADACRMAASLVQSGMVVLSLDGGIEGWKKDGLPVEVNSGVVGISVMRQVQLAIGVILLAASALAWFVDSRFILMPALVGLGLSFAGATGTCALASLLSAMPWNRAKSCGTSRGTSCASGSCG